MNKAAVVTGRNAFRSEIAAARDLGFRLQTRVDEGTLSHTAFARLVPTTRKAQRFCQRHGKAAVEAKQVFTDKSAMLDAIRSAIGEAITFAKDHGA